MTLVKWKKRNDAFPSTFSSYLDNFFSDDLTAGFRTASSPSVNIKETDGSYELELAAPGFEKSDFIIDVDHNVLTVSSEKESNVEDEGENFTRREFNYASFKRSFTIPESVNADKIKAGYNNGILNISLPKKEEAKVTKKTVKIS